MTPMDPILFAMLMGLLLFLVIMLFGWIIWRGIRLQKKEYEVWMRLVGVEHKAFNAKSKDELRDAIQILIDMSPLTHKCQKNESYSLQIGYYCKGRLEGSP